jgi:hypothetical protein
LEHALDLPNRVANPSDVARAISQIAVGAIAVLGLTACGGSVETDNRHAPVLPDTTQCLNCGGTQGPEDRPSIQLGPHVAMSPLELLFFPDSNDSPEFDPKDILVTNNTGAAILVTHAFLANDLLAPGGAEGVDYFEVSTVPEEIALAPGESVRFWARFLGSVQQRSALFVVQTSDRNWETLTTDLVGKYFLGP